jgi:hypothetical protein
VGIFQGVELKTAPPGSLTPFSVTLKTETGLGGAGLLLEGDPFIEMLILTYVSWVLCQVRNLQVSCMTWACPRMEDADSDLPTG